jgi:hypothetical protein
MITKTKLMQSVQQLPEEFSIDELIERLIVIQKIESGLKDSAEAKVNTEAEAKEKLSKWLK